jgi:cell division GTPase FtsZ
MFDSMDQSAHDRPIITIINMGSKFKEVFITLKEYDDYIETIEDGSAINYNNIQWIINRLSETDMLVIIVDCADEIESNRAITITEISKNLKLLTIAITIMPSSTDYQKQYKIVNNKNLLRKNVNSLLMIPGLFNLQEFDNDFLILKAIQGVTELIARPGLIAVNFYEVRSVLECEYILEDLYVNNTEELNDEINNLTNTKITNKIVAIKNKKEEKWYLYVFNFIEKKFINIALTEENIKHIEHNSFDTAHLLEYILNNFNLNREWQYKGVENLVYGKSQGENRSIKAVQNAIFQLKSSKNIVSNATGFILNIRAGMDMAISEFEQAVLELKKHIPSSSVVVYGTVIDLQLEGKMEAIIISKNITTDQTSKSVKKAS